MCIGQSGKRYGSIVYTMRGAQAAGCGGSKELRLFIFLSLIQSSLQTEKNAMIKIKLHQRQRQEATLTGRGPLSSELWQRYLFQYFTKYARKGARKLQKNSRASD